MKLEQEFVLLDGLSSAEHARLLLESVEQAASFAEPHANDEHWEPGAALFETRPAHSCGQARTSTGR